MRLKINKKYIILFVFIFIIGCATTQAVQRGSVSKTLLHDGVFNAEARKGPVKAIVAVTIKNNTILSVNILKHRTMGGHEAEAVIPKRIVQSQSTDVDIVSGATYSSLAIMNATQRAINQSADIDN